MRWIVIFAVDSAIQLLNKWCLKITYLAFGIYNEVISHYFLVHFIKLSLDSSSFNLECYKKAGHT